MRLSRFWFVSLACAASLSLSSLARAQLLERPTWRRDEPGITLKLRSANPLGIRLELYNPDKTPPDALPDAVCFDRCVLKALPGRYLLRVSGPPGSDVHASRRYVRLTESSIVVVDPPSSLQRYIGLGLGLTASLTLTGLVALKVLEDDPLVGRDPQPSDSVINGLIGVSMVVTPIGWILYASNGRPAVDVRPLGRRHGSR